MISIWFFIGLLLLAYGVLILGSGLYEYFNPPVVQTVKLPELHAAIWWGARLSPSTRVPKAVADTGISSVTSMTLMGPAVALMRKKTM